MKMKNFEELLNEQYDWPSEYHFKFLVKTDFKHEVIEELEDHAISERESKNGNYTSITSTKIISASTEVIEVYERIGKIKGVLTL